MQAIFHAADIQDRDGGVLFMGSLFGLYPFLLMERGPVCIGHKHRGGAAVGYFSGLDVSLEETAICIVDDAGRIVREACAASEPDVLIEFFGARGMEMERVGLEACSPTAWLHAGLTEAGIPAICIEARQAKAAMGAMPNKTDRNDARGIAQIVRTGWYRAVHCEEPVLPLLARAAHGTADADQQAPRHREWHPGAATRGQFEGRHAEPQDVSRAGGSRQSCAGLQRDPIEPGSMGTRDASPSCHPCRSGPSSVTATAGGTPRLSVIRSAADRSSSGPAKPEPIQSIAACQHAAPSIVVGALAA
jgi:hypothetical protein